MITLLYFFPSVDLPLRPGLSCSAEATTIDCTWSQPSTDSVTNYLFSWRYLGPCDADTQSFFLDAGARAHSVMNLEEGGEYVVSLIAMNNVGQSPEADVAVTTQSTGMTDI